MYVKARGDLCSYCNPTSNKRQRTQEMQHVKRLRENPDVPAFVHNRGTGFACGNYRPDLLFDMGTFYVVNELDEKQHNSYDPNCEVARMFNIEQSLGMRTHFIRFNPDKYTPTEGEKYVMPRHRLKYLVDKLVALQTTPPIFTHGQLSVEYMFHDADLVTERMERINNVAIFE